jgi:precorrin-2/cobalt-factor-2 C20-methyltransferase
MTLKAVRVLMASPIIFTPQAAGSKDSLALAVARKYIDESRQRLIYASFVMGGTSDDVWSEAAERIAGLLLGGDDVAFLTQGDPLLYGSFMYVMVKVQAAHPQIPIEVVPGVTSITASASRAKMPLVSHAERLAVLPAMYGIDDLREVLERNDTVVLMKVNRKAMRAVSQMEADGDLSRCVFVRRATTPRERVEFSLRDVRPEDTDYFSMLILSGKKRTNID